MKYRTLGRTGVQVSCLCLGTLTFGREADEQSCAQMFHLSRDAGINLYDTADVYNGGRSEEILGRLTSGCREEIVLSSKVFFPVAQNANSGGHSRRHIMLAVEASLKRLKTDRLDLYFLHAFDLRTDMEETLRALDDLVQQGKVLYPAVSNWAAWQIAKALGSSDRRGFARFACVQPLYNLVKRQAEVEILPMAQAEQLGVMTYNSVGGGLLTGKYGTRAKPEHGRLVDNLLYTQRYEDPANFDTAERFTAHAKEHGIPPAALAIAWVMSHPAVTSPILGARTPDQLKILLGAADISMSPEWRAEISGLSKDPPPVTDRSEEKAGAFYGPP
jgi:aryl-alcohol dehydrogenase-like predicted oxidoreductase